LLLDPSKLNFSSEYRYVNLSSRVKQAATSVAVMESPLVDRIAVNPGAPAVSIAINSLKGKPRSNF